MGILLIERLINEFMNVEYIDLIILHIFKKKNMNTVDPESLILAHNLKSERTAIPVVITTAVKEKRIDPNEYIDEGVKVGKSQT